MKEQSLSEILDFAIRDVVEKASLTDEMICPMIADLKLDVWVTSYCNVYFYRSEVLIPKFLPFLIFLGLGRKCQKQSRSVAQELQRRATNHLW